MSIQIEFVSRYQKRCANEVCEKYCGKTHWVAEKS